MYKLVVYMLVLAVFTLVFALQAEQEMAMQALFRAKRAVNYAAHAGAQQVDAAKLSAGIVALDPAAAETAALTYLRANLQLDESNAPLPGSFLRTRVDVLAFDVVNDTTTFPYTYSNGAYGFTAQLRQPGVALVARVEYPRLFSLLPPIVWNVKGAAELVR
ncbi:MAG: hypothetical protein J7639_05175 [Paenibacillaceae bacterium]|nr:hypothetical protein [Paenibacillaceae bacterium]